jgi:uncharacterized membrane-anchored protein
MKVSMIRYRKKITGNIKVDGMTKILVKRLKPGNIAVINHSDLDEVAAHSLIEKNVKAIINFGTTITGSYPTNGAIQILKASIPIFDAESDQDHFSLLKDDLYSEIIDNHILSIPSTGLVISLRPITAGEVERKLKKALERFDHTFLEFAENSLHFAKKESREFLKPLPSLPLKTKLSGRSVVLVTRGWKAREDLLSLIPYIRQHKPVLIGVDGGADLIYQHGFTPDIVIGDMDSVSDHVLKLVQDRIVHSYPNGAAPGINKLQQQGLKYHVIPFIGTSEDIALLLAFQYGAKPIVLVGSHSHMMDFLEKGRKGMGSTLLTRMKVGHHLIDAKGIHQIYPATTKSSLVYLWVASLLPFTALLIISPKLRLMVNALWLQIWMLFN